jgi:hypothetical protein
MSITVEHLPNNASYDYLLANNFIDNFSSSQALSAAFDIGLIDLFKVCAYLTIDDITSQLSIRVDSLGLNYLLGMLCSSNIIEREADVISLTDKFSKALVFQDFIQAQIAFANLVANDVVDFLPLLLESSEKFMAKAALFELFDYSRAIESTPENLAFTRRWMNFTTALTRYEAQVCCSHHSFTHYQRIMDIGGNSGEFVLQICKQFPSLEATVIDLPLVCDIGRKHVDQHPEGARINFYKANALVDRLPKGFDLISFKSILHDWPEPAVQQFIRNSLNSLNSGGKLLIYERDVIDCGADNTPYYLLPMLLFFRSFRSSDFYCELLKSEGLIDIRIQYLQLETPFYLITATKP